MDWQVPLILNKICIWGILRSGGCLNQAFCCLAVLCKGVMWHPHEGQDLGVASRILSCSELINVVLMLIAVCQ